MSASAVSASRSPLMMGPQWVSDDSPTPQIQGTGSSGQGPGLLARAAPSIAKESGTPRTRRVPDTLFGFFRVLVDVVHVPALTRPDVLRSRFMRRCAVAACVAGVGATSLTSGAGAEPARN